MLTVLFALCASRASAQDLADYDYENLSFRGIGFDYGYIWPNKVAATSTYTVRVDLGFLGPGLRIVPQISYWNSVFKASELDRLAAQINRLQKLRDEGVVVTAADLGQMKWTDLSLGADAQAVWTVPGGILTYAGLGAAVHVLNGKGDFIKDTFVEDLLDTSAAGLSVMGGVEFEVMPRFRLYGEARYTIASDVRFPGLRVGGALMLPSTNAAQRKP